MTRIVVHCESCDTGFYLDSSKIGDKGKVLRCTVCGYEWFFESSHESEEISNYGSGEQPNHRSEKIAAAALVKKVLEEVEKKDNRKEEEESEEEENEENLKEEEKLIGEVELMRREGESMSEKKLTRERELIKGEKMAKDERLIKEDLNIPQTDSLNSNFTPDMGILFKKMLTISSKSTDKKLSFDKKPSLEDVGYEKDLGSANKYEKNTQPIDKLRKIKIDIFVIIFINLLLIIAFFLRDQANYVNAADVASYEQLQFKENNHQVDEEMLNMEIAMQILELIQAKGVMEVLGLDQKEINVLYKKDYINSQDLLEDLRQVYN